ncbi:unnamed protein product [Ambrosiozyma monospora]|uniref:Unnamed protein product n=1 Tax=Ambrosiozyma monospora TaxID=43982 RepID=A0ACB5UAP2_AMBMO|nr:unnamed protein product [Ambrosiozyma monospora]
MSSSSKVHVVCFLFLLFLTNSKIATKPIATSKFSIFSETKILTKFITLHYQFKKLTAEEIRQRKFLKRGLFLNILVLGQTGTGKATFINTLCDEDIVATNRAAPSELNIEQHTAKIYEGGTQINLDITMIPGFGDFIDNKRATGVVIKHIETQFDNMLDEECKIQRSKKSRDSRIHAALYFIRPTG